MSKSKSKKGRYTKPGSTKTDQMVRNLDKLSQYDEWVQLLPKDLQRDFLSGMSAQDLYAKYANAAALRAIHIALTEDPSKALTAIKDIIDRDQGKAIERKQMHHVLDEVEDQQLDALIASELETLTEMDDPSEPEDKGD